VITPADTLPGTDLDPPVIQSSAVGESLSDPGSIEGDEIKIMMVIIKRKTADFIYNECLLPPIMNLHTPGNHIFVLKNSVREGESQMIKKIKQNKFQSLHVLFTSLLRGWETMKLLLPIQNPVGLVEKVKSPVPVFRQKTEGGIPIVSFTKGAVFQKLVMKRKPMVFITVSSSRSIRKLFMVRKILKSTLLTDPPAVIEMGHMT